MNVVEKKIDELKPYENNPRNNDNAIKPVAESIKQFGFKVPIVIDSNGVIVCGHTRYKAAKTLKLETVPCIIADDLTDEQIKAFRLADNKVGELAEWDFEKLYSELTEISDIDMEDFNFDLSSFNESELSFEEQDRIFKERMANGELSEDSEEYQEFLKKFEPKRTTDDCYTPENIYNAVRDWVFDTYKIKGMTAVRPFYPGGDYQKENYSKNTVVIDNPPFSIITDICKWYDEHNVKYFLFAPNLTLLGINRGLENYVVINVTITYENGAGVNTSFVTNLGKTKLWACPELCKIVTEENKINLQKMKKQLPKYKYPDEVVTSTILGYLAVHDTELKIDSNVEFIRSLDAQKEQGKGLFGSGFLISEKAAAEKAAAEKAAAEVWELSEREKEIVRSLSN